MGGDAFADIGEGLARADIARGYAWSICQDGHALAGVVAAAPGGIAAVIGGDDDKVAVFESHVELRQAPIEGFERRRIARHVTPVAEIRVEIDEIGKDQIAVLRFFERFEQRWGTNIETLRGDLPGTDYPVVMTMHQRDRVTELGRRGKWILLRHASGKTGWAHGDYLVKGDPGYVAPPNAGRHDGYRGDHKGGGWDRDDRYGHNGGRKNGKTYDNFADAVTACLGRTGQDRQLCVLRNLGKID